MDNPTKTDKKMINIRIMARKLHEMGYSIKYKDDEYRLSRNFSLVIDKFKKFKHAFNYAVYEQCRESYKEKDNGV